MSNRKKIQEWVDNEYDFDEWDSAEDLYDDIDSRFEQDNRSGLDDVLLDEKSEFMIYLQEQIAEPPEREQPPITQEEPLFLPTAEPFEEVEPPTQDTGIINSIRRFFRF